MDETTISALTAWIINAGCRSPRDGHAGRLLRAGGVGGRAARRGLVVIDTLHPVYEGRAFRWRDAARGDGGHRVRPDQRRARPPRMATKPVLSAVHDRRRPSAAPPRPGDRSTSRSSRRCAPTARPTTSAFVNRSRAEGRIGEMDCVYAQWTTRPRRRDSPTTRSTPAAAPAAPRARDQMRLARAHRRARWSRPTSGAMPASGCCRPDRARRRRPDQRGALVLRSARLHPHHRHRAAGARSSRSSTTMPTRSSRPSMSTAATC